MDPLGDLVISMILAREAELVELMEAGLSVEDELDVVRVLLQLNFFTSSASAANLASTMIWVPSGYNISWPVILAP
jgi:hypothetical protein